MSRTVEPRRGARLPARVTLILLVCAGSLALHFACESLGTTGPRLAIETLENGRAPDPEHREAEEAFITTDPAPSGTAVLCFRIGPAAACDQVSRPSAPLLPPPKTH